MPILLCPQGAERDGVVTLKVATVASKALRSSAAVLAGRIAKDRNATSAVAAARAC